jgi:hypothetical protein
MDLNRKQRFAARPLRVLLLMLLWYLSCFFLMMEWRVSCYDPNREAFEGSAHYLSPTVQVPSQFTMVARSSTWANLMFQPIDALLQRVKDAAGFQKYAGSRVVSAVWLFAFGANLLVPFFAVVLRRGQSPKVRGGLALLALLAAGWYCGQILLYHAIRMDYMGVLLGKTLDVSGTVVAIAALCWIGHARGYQFVAPLAFATLFNAIWLLTSLPCSDPYM